MGAPIGPTVGGAGTTHRRIQLEMSARAVAQLDSIQKSTDAVSRAEVIRNALKVYGYLVQEREKGFKINILKTTGEEEVEVELPGVGIW